jgi:hypothetical protein
MNKNNKKRGKFIKIKLSRKDKSSRLIIKNREILGIDWHGMYEHDRTVHFHIGSRYKIVLYPKDLIGLWKKKKRKYVRIIPKDTKKRKRRKSRKA